MKLQYVRAFPSFSWICLGCGKQQQTDGSGWMSNPIADLDGPAFKAYYHDVCLWPKIIQEERLTGQEVQWAAQQPIDTDHQ